MNMKGSLELVNSEFVRIISTMLLIASDSIAQLNTIAPGSLRKSVSESEYKFRWIVTTNEYSYLQRVLAKIKWVAIVANLSVSVYHSRRASGC